MTDEQLTVAVLDSNSLLNRAFYALPLLTTRNGEVTNAVYGFIMMLQRLLDEQRPDRVIATFDKPAPTFRHVEYQEYKAHRRPMPDDLRPQVPLLKEFLRAYGIPVLELEGYEADDLIGTVTRRAEAAGLKSVIVTGDRDSLQLASRLTSILLTKKGISEVEVYGPETVAERYGVTPEQFIDIKGLMGDTSDNIPGVPGIGEKTAQRLIQEYGSVEAVLNSASGLSPKLQSLLTTHAEQARLSRRLATIDRDAPVDVEPASLPPPAPDPARLHELFVRCEFRALDKKLATQYPELQAAGVPPEAAAETSGAKAANAKAPNGKATAAGRRRAAPSGAPAPQGSLFAPAGTEEMTAGVAGESLGSEERPGAGPAGDTRAAAGALRGTTLLPPGGIDPLLAALKEQGVAAIEGFVARLSPWETQVRGLAVALPDASLYFVSNDADHADDFGCLLEALRGGELRVVGHDLKALGTALGRPVRRSDFDVMLASYVLDPTRGNHSLEEAAFNYLGYSLPDKPAILATPIAVADLPAVAGYFGARAAACLALSEQLRPVLEERGVRGLFRDLEMPLVEVLRVMEERGVAVDVPRLAAMSGEMERRVTEITRDIFTAVGEEFNINSPKQLATILFDKLGLAPKKKTKTGFSTNAEVLEELAEENPVAAKILEYRQVVKLKTTYVDALPALINPATGRIHTTFNQAVTATGRLSSTNPNLQNIPIRSDEGGRIREAFVTEKEGYSLLSADYSQIELRVLAHMSKDPVLCEAFRAGEDIHTRTAAEVFGVPISEVTPSMRSGAKAVNFGIVYGISSFGLARGTGISKALAQEYIEGYFRRYAQVKAYLDRVVQEAREAGYVTTLLGRRRYLPDLHNRNYAVRSFAERTAMNTPIQGSAADIIKLAMLACEERLALGGFATRMILQVHDELVFEGPASEIPVVAPIIKEAMEKAYPLDVPLDVEIEAGVNWREGRKLTLHME